jgi:hypothetical protein
MKCLNFEDGHKYTFTINQIYMKISMDAVFNTYFHMNYDIKLNKKILSSEELLNNVTSALVKQDKKIEELTNENELLKKEFNNVKKENEKLMTKIDYLYKDYEINISLLSNAEISIGLMKNQQNQMSSIHIPIGIETLKFNLTGYIFTLYFDKIKLLTKLKTMYLYSSNNSILQSKMNQTPFNFEILVEHCKKNCIQLYVDDVIKVDNNPKIENLNISS